MPHGRFAGRTPVGLASSRARTHATGARNWAVGDDTPYRVHFSSSSVVVVLVLDGAACSFPRTRDEHEDEHDDPRDRRKVCEKDAW